MPRNWESANGAHGICTLLVTSCKHAKLLEGIEASLVVCDVEEVGCLLVVHSLAQGHGGVGGSDEDRDAASHKDLAGAPRRG